MPQDTRYEILDGERILCMGEPEHARPQAQLAYVLSSLAGEGYDALVELTTRADTVPPPVDFDRNAKRLPSTVQDLRSDACILRQGTDPATGDRYLEELSFEVANTQSMADLRNKAQRLRARGVRRVFAILVKRGQVAEWSAAIGDFVPVVGEIRDSSLAMPLSVQALLQASAADDAVVRALLAKGNPVLSRLREQEHRRGHSEGEAEGLRKGRSEGEAEGLRKGRSEGEAEGLRLAIEDLCELLGIPLTAERRALLERARLSDLQTLRLKLKGQKIWPAI